MRGHTMIAAIGTMLAGSVQAAPLRLVYDGYLAANDTLGGVPLGSLTPFEAQTVFDGSVPLFTLEPGAAAYAPSTFTLTLGGTTYDVARAQDDAVYGQAVVIFDKSSPDANSPAYGGTLHYGVGFFSRGGGNVGVIGDWLAAAPEVTLGTLMPTTFTQFYGVGYNRGPIRLMANGLSTILQLNDLFDYNSADPGLLFFGPNVGAPTIPNNQASIQAVPEPTTFALLAVPLGLLGVARQSTPASASPRLKCS